MSAVGRVLPSAGVVESTAGAAPASGGQESTANPPGQGGFIGRMTSRRSHGLLAQRNLASGPRLLVMTQAMVQKLFKLSRLVVDGQRAELKAAIAILLGC